MPARSRWLGVASHLVAILLLVVGAGAVGMAREEASLLEPDRVGWREASYRGRKLFVSLEAEVEITYPSVEEARAGLETADEVEGLRPQPGRTVAVRLESAVLGSRSSTVLLADSGNAAALQRRQVRTKRNGEMRFKTLRFAADGVEIRFHDPAPGEPLDAPDRWTRLTTRFAPHPPWAGDEVEPTEPTALFYILAAAPLVAPSDVVQIPAVSKERLVMLELEAVGWEQIEVEYRRDGELVRGPVPALKILMDARDLDPESEDRELELIGLRGAITFHLDPETRVPLKISGRVPYFGHAEVHLETVTTR